MIGNNPSTGRSKTGIKRHILTDKNSIPLYVVITSANKQYMKAVTDVIDDAAIKRPTTTVVPAAPRSFSSTT